MLLAETQKYDIFTVDPGRIRGCPCAQICNEFHQGSPMDYDTVYKFGKSVDVLTIEIEHVNIEALKQLDAEGLKIFPQPSILGDHPAQRSSEGFLCLFYLLPTAPYHRFKRSSDVKAWIGVVKGDSRDFPFVWKSAQFGYDGTGVKIVRSLADLEGLPEVDCLVEEMIPFKNELAVIVAWNESGETRTYPVVEMEVPPDSQPGRVCYLPGADRGHSCFRKPAKLLYGRRLLRHCRTTSRRDVPNPGRPDPGQRGRPPNPQQRPLQHRGLVHQTNSSSICALS